MRRWKREEGRGTRDDGLKREGEKMEEGRGTRDDGLKREDEKIRRLEDHPG